MTLTWRDQIPLLLTEIGATCHKKNKKVNTQRYAQDPTKDLWKNPLSKRREFLTPQKSGIQVGISNIWLVIWKTDINPVTISWSYLILSLSHHSSLFISSYLCSIYSVECQKYFHIFKNYDDLPCLKYFTIKCFMTKERESYLVLYSKMLKTYNIKLYPLNTNCSRCTWFGFVVNWLLSYNVPI